MDDPRPAPSLRIALDDHAFDVFGVEDHPPLPELELDPEVRVAVERERYDEQILAALVFLEQARRLVRG